MATCKDSNESNDIRSSQTSTSTEIDNHLRDASRPFFPSYRLVVALLCMATLIASFSTQTSMNSAFVCMTMSEKPPVFDNDTTLEVSTLKMNLSGSQYYNSNSIDQNYSLTRHDNLASNWKFSWNTDEKEMALALFFIAFYIVQLPSVVIPMWFGIKNTLMCCLFAMSLFQLLAVPAARMGLMCLYIDRFMTGLATASVYTCVVALVTRWTPHMETSLMMAVSFAGLELGGAFSFGISSFACNSSFQGGWPLIFYILSGWSLMIGILGCIFLTDRPSDNRFLSSEEKAYILEHTHSHDEDLSRKNRIRIPVRQILQSRPVWALIVAGFSFEWMYFTVATQIPMFLGNILRLSELNVSLISSVPFVCMVLIALLLGPTWDWLVHRGVCSRTAVRKINDGFTKLVPGILIVLLGFLPMQSVVASYFVVFFMACGFAFYISGWLGNLADFSPIHAGFLTVLVQLTSMWSAFVVPLVFDVMTQDQTREQWQHAFYLTAGIQIVGFIFYAVFASGELQPWAGSCNSSEDVATSSRREYQEGWVEVEDPVDRTSLGRKTILIGEYDETSPLLT